MQTFFPSGGYQGIIKGKKLKSYLISLNLEHIRQREENIFLVCKTSISSVGFKTIYWKEVRREIKTSTRECHTYVVKYVRRLGATGKLIKNTRIWEK